MISGSGTLLGARISIADWNVWKNHAWILRQVSLEIPSGSFCVLAGRNGSGKSTFLRSVAGLVLESEGWQTSGQCQFILPDGNCSHTVFDRRRHVAYLAQQLSPVEDFSVSEFLSLAFEENLRLTLGPSMANFETSLKVWQSRRDLVFQTFGIPKLYNVTLSQLSGGQWQRVRLAECLAKPASIFILDEPDAFLDAMWRGILFDILSDFKENGSTLLVSLHRPHEAADFATQWLGFESGEMMFNESQEANFPAALLKRLFLGKTLDSAWGVD